MAGLLRRIRDMEESATDTRMLRCKRMQQRIHHVVADVGASRIGDLRRNAGLGHGLDHRLDGKRREVGVGTIGGDTLCHRLVPVIVRDAGIGVVDADKLRRNLRTAACLADAEHEVRLDLVDCLVHCLGALAENDRDLDLRDGGTGNRVRKPADSLPGRVHGLATERLEARHKNLLHAFLLSPRRACRKAGSLFFPTVSLPRCSASYSATRQIMRMVWKASMMRAGTICFLMTPYSSSISRIATGTMLKLAAIGVMSVPQ